jgi:D-glycero-D-manno-heptose 1,7-bisphosphate phosphatase
MAMSPERRAVFLDKDGTLIENVHYNVDPDLIRLTEGSEPGLVSLYQAGYDLFVVTNQAGVAHGYFPEAALEAVEQRIASMFNDLGIELSGFAYCPHSPEGAVPAYTVQCDCRKPEPGMIVQTAHEREIDLTKSWLIGDILSDVEAGNRAGCRTVLISSDEEPPDLPALPALRQPDFVADSLTEAALLILADQTLGPLEPSGTRAKGAP